MLQLATNTRRAINQEYDLLVHYTERERKVLELYDQGKSTRDIAKELRMSLRDISTILRKNQVSHGSPSTDNGNNNSSNNNKSPNQKTIQAYNVLISYSFAMNFYVIVVDDDVNKCF